MPSKYGKVFLIMILFSGLLLGKTVLTLGVSAELTIDSTEVGVGDTVQLSIAVSGTTSADAPQLKTPQGLQIQYLGPTTQFQIVNWKRTESITFNYMVSPAQPGRYTIGPCTIRAGSQKITTNAVTLTATSSAGSNTTGGNSLIPGAAQNHPQEAREKLFLTFAVPRNRFYVGEEVPVTIKLYVGDVKVDELSYPQFQQPQFVAGKMAKPGKSQEIMNGMPYQVLTFQTTLTPVKTGEYILGPVQLSCSVLVSDESDDDPFSDFFHDYQRKSVTLRSKSLHVSIQDLPAAGKPQNFSGGIGQFQMNVSANPAAVMQGDPVTVKIKLSGRGNLDSVAPPQLGSGSGFKVYDAARKNRSAGATPDDSSSGDSARFEQVVIPTDPKLKQLGPYVFNYFDPVAGRYRQIESAPLPLTVKANPDFKGDNIADRDGVATSSGERLGHDLIYIKDSPGSLTLGNSDTVRQPVFWLLQLVPLLAIAGSWGYRSRREKFLADTPQARAQRAAANAGRELTQVRKSLQDGRIASAIDDLQRILREYLAEKFNMPAAGMTQSVVADLQVYQVEPETLKLIEIFFSGYDFYKYTGAKPTVENGREFLDQAEQIIQALNRHESNEFNLETRFTGRKGES